jgi:hypothetical protein
MKRVLYHYSFSERLEDCEINENGGNCPEALRHLCVPYNSVLCVSCYFGLFRFVTYSLADYSM